MCCGPAPYAHVMSRMRRGARASKGEQHAFHPAVCHPGHRPSSAESLMSGTATANLAAAVSIAGGFGMLDGTSRGGPDWLRTQIRAVRPKTSRPFGVGFISSFPGIDDLVQVALEERVAAINL